MPKTFAIVISLCVSLQSHGAWGQVSGTPNQPDHVKNTWVGISDNFSLFRLLLTSTSDGVLAVQSSGKEHSTDIYRVTRIVQSKGEVSFVLEPVHVADQRTLGSEKLMGSWSLNQMRLEWSGIDNGHVFWSTKVVLEPENVIQARSLLIDGALKRYADGP